MLRAALMSRWTFTMGHAAFSHASTSALDRARGVDHQPNRYPRGRKRRNTYGRPRLVGANRWVALHTEHTCRATRQWGSLAPAPVMPREAPSPWTYCLLRRRGHRGRRSVAYASRSLGPPGWAPGPWRRCKTARLHERTPCTGPAARVAATPGTPVSQTGPRRASASREASARRPSAPTPPMHPPDGPIPSS